MDLSPLWISIKVAFISTFLASIFGIPLAWWVHRRDRGKDLFDSILTLPMVLPPTVVGFFLLLIFSKNGFFGRLLKAFGIEVIFTITGAIIAAFVVSFPLVYRSSRGAFEQVNPDFRSCARTLGISERIIFFKIILPNARSGILSGIVLAFSRAMGEFGATQMLAGNIPGKTQSMSLAVYSAVQNNQQDLALFWSLTIVLISIISMLLISKFSHMKIYPFKDLRESED